MTGRHVTTPHNVQRGGTLSRVPADGGCPRYAQCAIALVQASHLVVAHEVEVRGTRTADGSEVVRSSTGTTACPTSVGRRHRGPGR